MAASGFGREAGPLNRAPGSAPLAFGAGAAATPPPAAPPVPVQFPSARPVAPFVRPSPSFPIARPQLAASARPRAATAPIPIPSSSARPAATAPGASGSVRFPSPVRAIDPGAAAATVRHAARHLQAQPQPRLAAPSVGRPVHTVTSSRSRSPPHLSNQRPDSTAENDNGMGQRRLVNYADPLFEDGSTQPSVQMRMQPPEIGKTARPPPVDMTRQFRPSSSFQNYPPAQRADPRDHVQKPNLSPSKFGIQNRSPFHDARGASSPLLNSNLVPGSGMPHPALGTSVSSHYDNSTQPVMAQQEMNDHMRHQRFSAQSRTVDHNISKRSRSPTLSYQDVDGAEARHGTGANARRLIDYTDTLVDDASIETSKRMKAPSSEFRNMLKSPSSDIRDHIRSAPAGFRSNGAAQNLRSQADIQRPYASIPKVGGQIQSRIGDVNSPPYQMFRPSDNYSNEPSTPAFSPPKPSVLSSSRRSVTPPLDVSDGAIPSTELEREKQAKAKRLARFNVELSRPVENINDLAKPDKQKQTPSVGKSPDRPNHSTVADMDSPELAAILGLCSDMCPEPERAERERKGDLDRYERLGGDRNQTTELLAVKKYTRTAERVADLIRPLPVLQKTMAYLLSLLDHTYDESFLGLYNFLWDRMRAIRMDLRMQHFFNQESISMLEQMIRLHIVAMHELCEYSKGEGFSEGFDAHLNIEQMNKTSVELFQMYDDHRRKGVLFSSEKEFRGYYALLKLDKHPGYKVEPSELSLDLAKMSHEIRGSPDILFAREVARVCRMGNYIAFFRLARKATYLQACLMHAHFGKVRRQALASLHSGLQIGQGIPISHVVEWLAMEDEDIESLLEYHGFGSRQYDEPYLVKEGTFLNSERDFPSGCSELVHLKKSQRIVDDVSSGPVRAPTSQKATPAPYSGVFASPVSKRKLVPPQAALVIPVNAKREFGLSFSGPASPTSGRQITSPHSHLFSPNAGNKQFSSPYSGPISPTAGRKESVMVFPSTASPRATKRLHTGWMDEQRVASPKAKGKTKVPDDLITSEDHDGGFVEFSRDQMGAPPSEAYTQHIDALADAGVSHALADGISSDYPEIRGVIDEPRAHGSGSDTDLGEEGPSYREVNLIELGSPTASPLLAYEYGDQQINDKTTDDLLPIVASPMNKISDARLKMILRKWRQRAVDRRSLREQKNALAIAALNSLSLGPPVHQTASVPKPAFHELDIGQALKERDTKKQRSLSRLNVSELAGPMLIKRKPDARCICWKMLVLVPPGAMESQSNNDASKWLLEKLMSSGNEDNGLLFTSADLSIWRTWMGSPSACCLSVVRASDQHVIANGIADSTDCIVFVVSESIPWEMQKARFSSLLASIPPQSSLPLLILSRGTYNEGYDYVSQNIIDKLGASDPSEGKIASSLVVFLAGSCTEGYANDFLDDDKLREGLKWMANSLPLQPDVILVKTRELLLNYLNPSLEMLNKRAAPEVGPEHCISLYNNAVNQLGEEILAAVYGTPIPWPALEIDLLERSSSEQKFTEEFLPSIGWSLPSRIQPLVEIIERCKLPEFSDDLSWLKQGSYKGKLIQDQKLFLEEGLAKYLTQSARLFNGAQAVAEARIMVQKGVGLKVRDSYHYLVPNWVTIFRRIYNWRLASLSTGEFSEAYVLSQRLFQAPAAESNGATQHGLTANSETEDDESILEDHDMLPVMPSGLSLDEMIEVSRDPDSFSAPPVRPLPPRLPTPIREEPQAPAHFNGEVINPVQATDDDNTHDVWRRVGLRDLVPPGWDDELAKLEQQCAEVQSKIAEGLKIYGLSYETLDIVE